MSKIKLRAWHKKYKRFVYGSDCVLILRKNGTLDIHETECWDQDFNNVNRRVILTLCSGLKDCNRKHIYESDIIQRTPSKWKGLVIFENGAFKVKWPGYVSYLCDVHQNCKVIGNIFENPELLEGVNGEPAG